MNLKKEAVVNAMEGGGGRKVGGCRGDVEEVKDKGQAAQLEVNLLMLCPEARVRNATSAHGWLKFSGSSR